MITILRPAHLESATRPHIIAVKNLYATKSAELHPQSRSMVIGEGSMIQQTQEQAYAYAYAYEITYLSCRETGMEYPCLPRDDRVGKALVKPLKLIEHVRLGSYKYKYVAFTSHMRRW